jgi:hypothetical protein
MPISYPGISINYWQERIQTLTSKLRGAFVEKVEEERNPEIAELAKGIVEYARMIRDTYPQQRLFVNVTEVARRFREEPCRVVTALQFLGAQGRAEPIDRSENWKLQV